LELDGKTVGAAQPRLATMANESTSATIPSNFTKRILFMRSPFKALDCLELN
jgi:hypothetical protein